jgi:hypothetical protein
MLTALPGGGRGISRKYRSEMWSRSMGPTNRRGVRYAYSEEAFFRPYGRAWRSSVKTWYSESLRLGVGTGRRHTVHPWGVAVTTRSVSKRVGRQVRTGRVDLLW